jgi:quercetin dioxygenase-like cupin family protein
MATHVLRFFRDTLNPGIAFDLPAGCNRVLYVRSGSVRLRTAGHAAGLAANSAWHAHKACTVIAGTDGAEVDRWELARIGNGEQPTTAPVLEASLTLDTAARYLIRCDRVDFPPGGIAYTHTHRGPGIRCLLAGRIKIEVQGRTHEIRPGEAWFEAGPDAVLATASTSEPTSFARVMVLPAELIGKSSIRYVLPEDQDKPKRQTYQLFIDDAIEI